MKINISIFVMILLLSYNHAVTAQEELFALNPLEGRQVFKNKGCQNCHAIRGQGGKVAMDLGRNEYYGNAFDLAADLWNHSPIMQEVMAEMNIKRPVFEEDEMKQLMLYLYYLRYLNKTGNVLKGKKLLSEKGCYNCHKVRDIGNEIGPRLDKLPTHVSPLFMAQTMWNHGPEMADKMHELNLPWPKFENDDIVDLTNYLRILRKDAQPEEMYTNPGNPQKGKELIKSKGCLNCHTVQGQGSEIAIDLTEIEFNRNVTEMAGLLWNHGERMLVSMKKKKIAWPKFKDEEMGDLISYLYYLDFMESGGNVGRGEELFDNKGCASCHNTKAKTETAGPAISEFESLTSPVKLTQIMWNHAPDMEIKMKKMELDWPELTKNDIEDIYNFLSARKVLTGKN